MSITAGTQNTARGPSPRASLLDIDPELARLVPAEERDVARRAASGVVVRLGPGPTPVLGQLGRRDDVVGIYVAGGVLVREVRLARAAIPELVGPGDLIGAHTDASAVLPVEEHFSVVEPAQLLVLGAAAARAFARWPRLLAELDRRRCAQHLRATTLGAIAHLPNVDVRLLATFWHLAETWARVTADGTIVPFPLTHAMLGRFVGAQRPTVSLALAKLAGEGLVHRLPDETWLLSERSSQALIAMLEDDTAPPTVVVRARVAREAARERRSEASALHAQSDQLRRRRTPRDDQA